MKTGLYILFFLFLFIAACTKSDDEPQPHQDILRCKVNGVDWEAFDSSGGNLAGPSIPAIQIQYYENDNYIVVTARRINKQGRIEQAFSFSANDILANGILVNLNYRSKIFTDQFQDSSCTSYMLDSLVRNYVVIDSLDKENFRIMGRFEFTSINSCSDTSFITDGYFNTGYVF